MSTKRDQLIETAERLFYREGFHATGIDRILAEAKVARMTLYKHFPSKEALVLAVLARREQAYWARLTDASEAACGGKEPLLALFDAHGAWLIDQGRHGCMFMKAIDEYAAHDERIAMAATEHKRRLLTLVRELVITSNVTADGRLDEQLVMLMEGATAVAQVLGPERASIQARSAAEVLLARARAR